MKKFNSTLAILIGIIGVCFTAKASQAGCPAKEEGSVEIPMIFDFEKPEFKTKWIYDSLEPRLQLPNSSSSLTPELLEVNDGKLELSFCIKAEDLNNLDQQLKVNFASRSLTISTRPIRWEKDVINKNGQDIQIKQGKMPTIHFIDQADPDWIIVKQAELLHDSNGIPRIDLQIHNFTKKLHDGFELKLDWILDATNDPMCSLYPGIITTEIPIEVKFEKKDVSIASGDLQFQELIQRDSSYKRYCGGASFNANLGNIGQLPAAEILRVRYVFNKEILGNSLLTNLKSFKLFFHIDSGISIHNITTKRLLLITGNNVFPSIIRLSQ